MPKVNFQITPREIRSRSYRQTSNCDSLLHRISNFYYANEDELSGEDKRKILESVQQIDRANKVLNANARYSIYNLILEMETKYKQR